MGTWWRRWPRWARITAAVSAALFVLGAAVGDDNADVDGADVRAEVARPVEDDLPRASTTGEVIKPTTTTVAPPSTTTTAAPTTTTTAPPTTTTSPPPPPPPPTTAAPPPPAPPPPPPQAFAPVAPAGGCHPSYDPCVPIASDVDCASGSGNGPAYVAGPVSVHGYDEYDLDRDGNGVGCES